MLENILKVLISLEKETFLNFCRKNSNWLIDELISYNTNDRNVSKLLPNLYLLIQFYSQGLEKVIPKAWLIADDTIKDPQERFKQLRVDEQQVVFSLTPEEAHLLLSDLMKQACAQIPQRSAELTIIIILPRALLRAEVEKLTYEDNGGFPQIIGRTHRLVVRSDDCMKPLRNHMLNTKWENLKQNPKNIAIEQVEIVFNPEFNCNELRKSLQEKDILVVLCNLCQSKCDDLLRVSYSAGIPIVILSRCEAKNLKKSDDYLHLIIGKRVDAIIDQVKGLRSQAEDENHSGNNIVVIWEDNDTKVPILTFEFPT